MAEIKSFPTDRAARNKTSLSPVRTLPPGTTNVVKINAFQEATKQPRSQNMPPFQQFTPSAPSTPALPKPEREYLDLDE